MRRDAETSEGGASRHNGGLRVSAAGVAIGVVQIGVVLGLSVLNAGSPIDAASASPRRQPSPGRQAVAYVNGVPIMSDRLELTVNALIPQESFHRNVSPDKVAEFRRTALQTLVDEELQYQDAMRNRLPVSAGEIDTGLKEVAARYPSPDAFAAARTRAHLTEADVRWEVQRSILIRKARESAVTSRCRVGEAEAARFFEANRERFIMPEQLRIGAITIGVDPSSPPAAWAAGKARAEQVRRELLGGAAFDAMARRYSTDASRDKGGDMGFFHRGSLADEFEKATARLRPGQISAVVQTIYGYHVVRIAEVRPSRHKTFEEVAAELEKDLTAQRCAELNEAWLGRLRAGATLTPAGAGAPAHAPGAPAGGAPR
jgi:hypothetical protein